MIYLSLGVALIAIFMAWQANRKNTVFYDRITELNGRIYQTRREMLEGQEKMQRELTKLRFDLLKTQGNLQVTGGMTLDEVLMVHPLAGQVLAGFHIGGCASCAFDGSQRLDLAVASTGQSIEPILVALNGLLSSENQNEAIPAEMLKTPNVELTL